MTTESKDLEPTSDKALSEQDIDQFAYIDKSLVPKKDVRPGGRRQARVTKTPKEIFDGQESLHRHEMRKRKAMHQETPTVMNSTKVFVDTFRRIVSEETGGQASFPHAGSLMMECQSAQRVWDFLRNKRSFHQDVLMGWMRYAGGQFKKRVRSRRTITVSMLMPTWDGYKPFKPAIVVPAVSTQPLRAVSVKDTIGASMTDIFNKDRSRQEAIWLGMMAWGIPMTAHWIAPTSKNIEAEIRMSLAAHMDTPVRRGDVRDVFSTSLRWQTLVASFGLPLLDWQVKFADMAGKVGAFKAYPNRPDDSDYAQAFIASRLVKETT